MFRRLRVIRREFLIMYAEVTKQINDKQLHKQFLDFKLAPFSECCSDYFQPDLFRYKYPYTLIPVVLPAHIACGDETVCSETSAY
jgi:hypothetical protein